MTVKENVSQINNLLPKYVQLVAVSKTKPNEMIWEAIDAGQTVFGENKVQDLVNKYPDFPKNIQWHFIGHLQRNKVKFIAPFVTLIHGVDSLRLLKEINKEAFKNERIINVLLQFHIASESTKFGLDEDEARELLSSDEFKEMKNVSIAGVMGMATFTDDNDLVRSEFRKLKNIFDNLKNEFFPDKNDFKEISMGMSDDFQIAIEEGSTMVRIGSSIFGARN